MKISIFNSKMLKYHKFFLGCDCIRKTSMPGMETKTQIKKLKLLKFWKFFEIYIICSGVVKIDKTCTN
jgi:hypothetical protein